MTIFKARTISEPANEHGVMMRITVTKVLLLGIIPVWKHTKTERL